MLGLSIYSDKIKYIGIALITIVLVVTLYGFYTIVSDGISNFFGIESKEETNARIKVEHNILEEEIKNKDKVIKVNKDIATVKIDTIESYNETIKDVDKQFNNIKVIKEKPKVVVKSKTIRKNKSVKRNLKDKKVTKVLENKTKELPIIDEVITVDKKKYEQFGSEVIDSLFTAYNITNNINKKDVK